MSVGVSTSLSLNIGISAPCTSPVSYTFWGGIAQATQANPPYVYANNYSSNALAYMQQSSSKDCNQVPAYYGPGPAFPLPC
jgi:hypothetical protein